jgi:OmpA-OmpF porin, OOP family
MKLRNFAIAAGTMLVGMATAHATADRGWYIGLEAGANWSTDVTFAAVSAPGGFLAAGDLEFETGWTGIGTVGYAFRPNWRAELELAFRTNDIDAFCAGACIPTTGSIDQFSQMLNVIYDWNLGGKWSLATGLGVGGSYVEGDTFFGQDDDYVFAGQAIVGVNYQLSDRMDVVLNYRYTVTDDLSFTAQDPVLAQVWAAAADGMQNHAVTVGLRWDLQPTMVQAKPKDTTPQPRDPAKQYVVFFGFNKANLTSEAQAVVAEAAGAAKQMGTATIIVTGHTDTVGGGAYNARLSERRAAVVREELMRLGTTSKIVASGRGETELLVQTGDNVKEPQNRRTTIDLQ